MGIGGGGGDDGVGGGEEVGNIKINVSSLTTPILTLTTTTTLLISNLLRGGIVDGVGIGLDDEFIRGEA